MWVTCTGADLLLKVDWKGNVLVDWEWRRDETLTTATTAFDLWELPKFDRHLDYRDPETTREGVTNIIHLNGVNRGPEGLLLSFGRILSPKAFRRAKRASVLVKITTVLY